MEKINKMIVGAGSCCLILFALSFAFPNPKFNEKNEMLAALIEEDDGVDSPLNHMAPSRVQSPGGEMYQQNQLTPGEKMEEQIRQEQGKYYRSLQQDEDQYYQEVSPGDNDDPDFFDESHPLQEAPLQEEPLR